MPKVQSITLKMRSMELISVLVVSAFLLIPVAMPGPASAKPGDVLIEEDGCAVQPDAGGLVGTPSCRGDQFECKAKRFHESMRALKCSAAAGDGEAAYMLGKMYVHGIHVDPDLDLATRFWRMAAKSGHSVAQHDFAMLLLTEGFPTTDRIEEALYWLGTSASSGNALSAVVLGRIYEAGWYNVAQDLCLALNWYEAGELMGMPAPEEHLEQIRESGQANCAYN